MQLTILLDGWRKQARLCWSLGARSEDEPASISEADGMVAGASANAGCVEHSQADGRGDGRPTGADLRAEGVPVAPLDPDPEWYEFETSLLDGMIEEAAR